VTGNRKTVCAYENKANKPFLLAIYRLVARYYGSHGLTVRPERVPGKGWCLQLCLGLPLWKKGSGTRRVKPLLTCTQSGEPVAGFASENLAGPKSLQPKAADWEEWLWRSLNGRIGPGFAGKPRGSIDKLLDPTRVFLRTLRHVLSLGIPISARKWSRVDWPVWKTGKYLQWEVRIGKLWDLRVDRPNYHFRGDAPEDQNVERTWHWVHPLSVKTLRFLVRRILSGYRNTPGPDSDWEGLAFDWDSIEGWRIALYRLPGGHYAFVESTATGDKPLWVYHLKLVGTEQEMSVFLSRYYYGWVQPPLSSL
jgi:hypothetical protein